jgi:hypothetical protein
MASKIFGVGLSNFQLTSSMLPVPSRSAAFLEFGTLVAVVDSGIFFRASSILSALSKIPSFEQKSTLKSSRLTESHQTSSFYVATAGINFKLYVRVPLHQASVDDFKYPDSRGLLCLDHLSVQINKCFASAFSPRDSTSCFSANIRFAQVSCSWFSYICLFYSLLDFLFIIIIIIILINLFFNSNNNNNNNKIIIIIV